MAKTNKVKRVGFILSETLDRNIEIFCAATGTPKTALAKHLFVNFLEHNGFSNPAEVVKISCEAPSGIRTDHKVKSPRVSSRRRSEAQPLAAAG
jgi:hypothetical protein